MNRAFPILVVSAFIALPLWGGDSSSCAVVDIDDVGWSVVQQLKKEPGISWWLEAGPSLLACGRNPSAAAAHHGRPFRIVENANAADLVLVPSEARVQGTPEPLVRAGRQDVVHRCDIDRYFINGALPERVEPRTVRPNSILAQKHSNAHPQRASLLDPDLVAVANSVSAVDWWSDVVDLTSYSRSTHGTEILDARDWLVAAMEQVPGVAVTTPSFQVQGTTAWNVVGRMTGHTNPDSIVIIGGHYDSTCSSDPSCDLSSAPGAEDNASGCAGVLELQRVFAIHPPATTVVFVCYSGEEQGLYGSYDHVEDLVAAGEHDDVVAAIIMDMIAYEGDGAWDVLLESRSVGQGVLNVLSEAASLTAIDATTELDVTTSLFASGSDHVPYLQASPSIPAVLAIENDWSIYPDLHRTTDVTANLNATMAELILRMNAVAAAHYAQVEPSLVFEDGFESGATDRWTPMIVR